MYIPLYCTMANNRRITNRRVVSLVNRQIDREDFEALDSFSIYVRNNTPNPIRLQITDRNTGATTVHNFNAIGNRVIAGIPAGTYKVYLECETGHANCNAEANIIGRIR